MLKKNQMLKTFVSKLSKLLLKSKKAVIISHYNPDGDALGSALALYYYLLNKNITPTIVLPNIYPDFLNWMLTDEDLVIYSKKNNSKIKELLDKTDVIFCVDFNALHRTNKIGRAHV